MSAGTKSFIGIGATIVLIVACVVLYQVLGNAPALSLGAKLALAATAFAILLKVALAFAASKEFDWHNHGYDLCVMTLGTSLTTGASLYAYDLNKIEGFLGLVVLAFLLALFGTLMAGINLAEIKTYLTKNPGGKPPALRASANMLLGSLSLGFNIVIVITKADLVK